MKEIWKPIKGYDKYKISNTGKILGLRSGVELKYQYHNGYAKVSLLGNNEQKTFSVHCLVASNFLGYKPKDKPTIDHINGNKKDNSVCNLEYVSYSENSKRYYSKTKSTNGRKSFFNDDDVEAILFLKGIYTYKTIAEMYGVAPTTISGLVYRKR